MKKLVLLSAVCFLALLVGCKDEATVTPTPGEILRGKLFAGLTIIILTLVAAMPIAATCALLVFTGIVAICRAFCCNKRRRKRRSSCINHT